MIDFTFLCGVPDVEMSQEIIDHVQAQFDSMSREQIIQMITFDPEIDLLLDETIAIWVTQVSHPLQPQDQQLQAQQQIHPFIPAIENHIEYCNSDSVSDSLSAYNDDPLDIVFANEIQIEFQPPSRSIPFGYIRDPLIFGNHRNYVDGPQ